MDFNTLPPQVWPSGCRRESNGEVTFAGVAVSDLVKEFGSPLMLIDEDDFRARCRAMAEAFGAENVHYASKAFLSSTIARWIQEEGLHLDVASEGELAVALHGGFPAAHITAHGNNKSESFLQACLDNQVGTIVLDSFQELERLDALTQAEGKTARVLVRVKPGIEAHTHEFIATSHEDQKFGFSLASGSAYKAAIAAFEAPNIELIGLHCHIGSQCFDSAGFELAAERVLGLYQQLIPIVGEDTMSVLDLGGGYGIAYLEDEQPADVAAIAAKLHKAVETTAKELNITPPRLMVEPGRAIAGPAMITVYTVGTVKNVHINHEQTRRYIAVDGGMSDNIRPMLYGAEYDVRVMNKLCTGTPLASRIVGSHCESGDILLNDRQLPSDIEVDDLVAFAATGAYCYSMSSRYNMMLRPAVVAVSKEQGPRLMLRRETVEDFLALEA